MISSRRASTSSTSRAASGARPTKSPCQGFARTKQVPPDADLDIAADPRGVRSKKPRRSGAVGTIYFAGAASLTVSFVGPPCWRQPGKHSRSWRSHLGWARPDCVAGERTRTRKCRSEKISLKHPMNPLAFQNILGREIFRGGAANDLTYGSGAKTGQFEIDCPPGRALTTGVLARMVALFPPASPWWHGLPRLSKSATACSLCAGLCAQRERVCGYEHRA